MNKFKALIFLILTSGCSGLSVKRDYDRSADFTRLATYTWQAPSPQAGEAPPNSLMDARVERAVDAALAQKGHKKAAADQADYIITYHHAVKVDEETGGPRTGVGIGMGSGGGIFGGLSVGLGSGRGRQEYDALAIDALDPKTGKLLWRGSARPALSRNDPEKLDRQVADAVRQILARFPPEMKR